MQTTTLRRVGGSVMLTVPPSILEQLQLKVGATVGLTVDGGRIVLEPRTSPRYTLAELLAGSDYSQPQPAWEREWVDAPVAGCELL